MGISKVTMNTSQGEETLIDLTEDTVTPETLAEGTTAHNASGEEIEGTMPVTNVLYTEQNLTEEQQAQARTNIGALGADSIGSEIWTFTLEDGSTVAKKVFAAELLTVTINSNACYFEDGMTWAEWVTSEYNTIGVTLGEKYNVVLDGCEIILDETAVKQDDIVGEYEYSVSKTQAEPT